jgi:hypothetical protein
MVDCSFCSFIVFAAVHVFLLLAVTGMEVAARIVNCGTHSILCMHACLLSAPQFVGPCCRAVFGRFLLDFRWILCSWLLMWQAGVASAHLQARGWSYSYLLGCLFGLAQHVLGKRNTQTCLLCCFPRLLVLVRLGSCRKSGVLTFQQLGTCGRGVGVAAANQRRLMPVDTWSFAGGGGGGCFIFLRLPWFSGRA